MVWLSMKLKMEEFKKSISLNSLTSCTIFVLISFNSHAFMLAIIIFFIAHWYLSLFAQSFFHHRYAAHRAFTMSPFWEKFFFVYSYVTQGSSYMSPRVYGILHRIHHAALRKAIHLGHGPYCTVHLPTYFHEPYADHLLYGDHCRFHDHRIPGLLVQE